MRPDPQAEGARWLEQAERDLEDARYLEQGARHNAACFVAQQSAEKAVKAVLYAAGEEFVGGHSVADLLAKAGQRLSGLGGRGAALDKLYIPTRYPNALPGGIPARAYGASDAARALEDAAVILAAVREVLKSDS